MRALDGAAANESDVCLKENAAKLGSRYPKPGPRDPTRLDRVHHWAQHMLIFNS